MPTVLDATVVASAYDTSGNGGRKLVRLSNGWLVSVVKNGTTSAIFYKSTDNGTTWSQLCFFNVNTQDIALVANGTKIYALSNISGNTVRGNFFDALTVSNVDVYQTASLFAFPAESTVGNTSLAINEAKTKLYASWASKNPTYANSFNIRFAEGTIATDSSVAWGAVEQWTTYNATSNEVKNPSISTDKNGKPIVFVEVKEGTSLFIIAINTGSNAPQVSFAKNYAIVYSGGTYTQSTPSAIFVPQSINGLANGRIWVAWSGTDATDTAAHNIRVSYSDDGGVTWSAMQKLTNGNTNTQSDASITASKNGKTFIVWTGVANTRANIRKISYDGIAWNSITNVTNHTASPAYANFPSTLFDLSVNFTEPLFTHKSDAKVGFYGTWTITTISVTQGSIGQKTSPSNVLTYAITTDGTMSTITEKVNGVTVGTKTATSGESLIAGLTQAQWDAVKFGKYKDVTAGLNTLTIEMGTEVFTYTFDKRPATDADMLSVTKAVQDSANVYLPAVKSKLGTAIRAKGGTVNDTDSLEMMISAVQNDTRKKWASGKVTGAADLLTVSGLTFTPKYVIVKANVTTSQTDNFAVFGEMSDLGTVSDVNAEYSAAIATANFSSSYGTFSIAITIGSAADKTWIAFE